MKKGLGLATVLIIAAMVLAACGGSGGSGGSGSGGGGAANFTVTAKESGCPNGATYCWDPADLSVNSGQSVTVVIKNPSNNANAHSFEIKGIGGTATGDLNPGQDKTVSFTAPAAGDYQIVCDV